MQHASEEHVHFLPLMTSIEFMIIVAVLLIILFFKISACEIIVKSNMTFRFQYASTICFEVCEPVPPPLQFLKSEHNQAQPKPSIRNYKWPPCLFAYLLFVYLLSKCDLCCKIIIVRISC